MDTEIFFGIAVLVFSCLALPVVAIYRTRNVRNLELRLAAVEAKLAGQTVDSSEPIVPEPIAISAPASPRLNLETLVGQKLIGWVAILLIFLAACFFLKYAFENQWIGELGRVTLEILAGLAFLYAGRDRYRKNWTYFSQVLTAGGVTILYLSIYGAFAYYHLIGASVAFVFLAVIVAESYLLSLAYNAPAIAIVATLGGFLNPVLLNTGRDRYAVLFTYIVSLDIGVLAVVIARRWRFLPTIAYCGTQLLFWAWYEAHYHPQKRAAATLFQVAVLLIFLTVDAAPRFRQAAVRWEEWTRLAVNPFVFFGIVYALWNGDRHEWMGVAAIGMAILYAGLGRRDFQTLFATVGTALTFITLAIPIQLNADWTAIAWGLEGLVFLWAAERTVPAASRSLQWFAAALFTLSLGHYLFFDTHVERALFTPVVNRYFFETAALAACLGAAAWRGAHSGSGTKFTTALGLAAAGVLWFGSSIEAYSYFQARAEFLPAMRQADRAEMVRNLRWAGQLSLSLIWSFYAVCLTAAGFRYHRRAFRTAGLLLFGFTLVKLLLFDTSELAQFYRIVAFLAVGLLLLGVAFTYQRASKRENTNA